MGQVVVGAVKGRVGKGLVVELHHIIVAVDSSGGFIYVLLYKSNHGCPDRQEIGNFLGAFSC